MQKKEIYYHRGCAYLANLPYLGPDIPCGIRPIIILQNEIGNIYSPNVTYVPITSKAKNNGQNTHYILKDIPWLRQNSVALCENLNSIQKEVVLRFLGRLTKEQMEGIDQAVANQIGIRIPDAVEAP